jgi:hypothetical protein
MRSRNRAFVDPLCRALGSLLSLATEASMPSRPAVLAALCALGVALGFLMLVLYPGGTDPFDPSASDLLTYYYPTLRYGFAELRAGHLPLWSPRQACGLPLLTNASVGLLYPIYWLTYGLLPSAVAVDVDLVVHVTLGCLGMALLCRHLGIGWGAAFVAGLVYTYTGPVRIRMFFPNFLVSVAWLPAIVLLVDRTLERASWRRCGLLSLAAGVMLLGGYRQFEYYAALALLPFVALRGAAIARSEGLGTALSALGRLALAGTVALLLGLVQLAPAAEFVGLSWRPPETLTPEQVGIMAIAPSTFLRELSTVVPRGVPEVARQVWVGLLPLALALVGLVTWRRRAVAWSLAAVAATSVLYAFGSATPVFALAYRLPGGRSFRGLDRTLLVYGFAVAVLCGAGADTLLRPDGKRSARGATGVLLALALMVAFAWIYGDAAARAPLLRLGAVGAFLVLAASLLVRRGRIHALAATLLALAVLIDVVPGYRQPGMRPRALAEHFARYDEVFSAIAREQGLARTYIWLGATGDPLAFRSDLAKAGLNHGIWLATDYEALCDWRFERYLAFPTEVRPWILGPWCYRALALSPANVRLADLMGVRFFVLPADSEDAHIDAAVRAGWREWLRVRDVVVYENTAALPRALLVHHVEVVPPDAVLGRLAASDPTRVAFVEEPLAAPVGPLPDEPARVEIVAYDANRVVVDTASSTPALLVLTDRWYPGWRATVDGVPTPLVRTDYLFRGVPVAGGSHRVELIYRPRSLLWGLAGSAVGLVAVGLLLSAHT